MTSAKTGRISGTSKTARLLKALDEELLELESAYNLQFDSTASLHDKLVASKRARTAIRKSKRLRDLIAQTLLDPDD